jgi:Na+/H+ antiporter NhaD/arsenite permease-like protein
MVRWSQVAHVAHGAVAGFLWWIDWRVSLFLFLQFFLYEYFEETKVKDEMYYELREWAAGFVIALLIVLAFILLAPPAPAPRFWIGGGGGPGPEPPRLMSF